MQLLQTNVVVCARTVRGTGCLLVPAFPSARARHGECGLPPRVCDAPAVFVVCCVPLNMNSTPTSRAWSPVRSWTYVASRLRCCARALALTHDPRRTRGLSLLVWLLPSRRWMRTVWRCWRRRRVRASCPWTATTRRTRTSGTRTPGGRPEVPPLAPAQQTNTRRQSLVLLVRGLVHLQLGPARQLWRQREAVQRPRLKPRRVQGAPRRGAVEG